MIFYTIHKKFLFSLFLCLPALIFVSPVIADAFNFNDWRSLHTEHTVLLFQEPADLNHYMIIPLLVKLLKFWPDTWTRICMTPKYKPGPRKANNNLPRRIPHNKPDYTFTCTDLFIRLRRLYLAFFFLADDAFLTF